MKYVVKVRPAKKQASIVRLEDGTYIADVDAPAKDNKANDRLIELFADYLDISKSRIRIHLGRTSKLKILEVE